MDHNFVIVRVGDALHRRPAFNVGNENCVLVGAFLHNKAVAHPNYNNQVAPIFHAAGITNWSMNPVSYKILRSGEIKSTADPGCYAKDEVVDMVIEDQKLRTWI